MYTKSPARGPPYIPLLVQHPDARYVVAGELEVKDVDMLLDVVGIREPRDGGEALLQVPA